MNEDTIAEMIDDLADSVVKGEEAHLPKPNSEEYPFYIVPRPPIPGKTRWSVTPC